MNRTWFKKNLGDAMLAGISLDELEESFQLEFIKANSPIDMALFARHESEGRLHCEVVVYFSPASYLIAKQIGATSCCIPTPHDLSLKIGNERSWSVLFTDLKSDKAG